MTHTRLHLSDADWISLRDMNHAITGQIRAKLPPDWQLPEEDIQGAVYDTFLRLLANYRHGAMSPLTYCQRYAESYTQRDLRREYKTLKNQLQACDLLEYQDEEGNIHEKYHEVRDGDVDALSVDGQKAVRVHMAAKEMLDRATPEDREIMEEIMQGRTYEEIARKRGVSATAIFKKLKKYR